jgi:hypothetical protein
MYTRYDYFNNAPLASLIADIALILTGTTNKYDLSAACDYTGSSISGVAAGWVLHDNAAATNTKVFKALCADGSTYKYMKVGVTATTLAMEAYEAWNATTHTGTNPSTGSGGPQIIISIANGGTLFFFATARYATILSWIAAGAGFQSSVSALERTRMSPWDTTAVGIVPVVLVTSNAITGGAYAPRSKSATFVDVVGGSSSWNGTPLGGTADARMHLHTVFGTHFYGGVQAFVQSTDAAGVKRVTTAEIYANCVARGDLGGQLYGIRAACRGTGLNTTDELTIDGDPWFLFVVSNPANTYSSTDGVPSLAFPKV